MEPTKIFNFLIPESKGENFEDYRRARILAALFLFMLVIAPFYAINYYISGSSGASITVVLAFFVCLGFMLLLKKTGNVILLANMAVGSLLILLLAQAYFTGGIQSPTFIWMVILPLIAGVTAGPRSSITWGVITIVTLLFAYYWEISSFDIQNDFAHLNYKLLWLTEAIGLTITVAVFSNASEMTGKISSKIIKEHHKTLQLISTAIDVASDAIHVIDTDSNQLYRNRRFLEMFGFEDSKQIVHADLLELFPDKNSFDEIVQTVIKNGFWSGDIKLKRKNGISFDAHLRKNALVDEKGKTYAIVGIITDITEQKQITEALKESEEKYRLIAENANDVIWIRDFDLNLKYISPGVERMRGFEVEDYFNYPVERFMTPESLNKAAVELSKAMELVETNPDAVKIMEMEMYNKEGGTSWCELSISFWKDEHGVPQGIIGVTRDIDARKRAEEELKTVRKEAIENAHKAGMADIASSTLHNVGNILNSVKTSLHTAKTSLQKSSLSEFKKSNQILRSNQDHLKEFILNEEKGQKLIEYYLTLENALDQEQNDLWNDINRIDEKVANITDVIASQQGYAGFTGLCEEADLTRLINDVLEIQAENLKASNIKIEKSIQPLPKINIQKTKLLHILVNLVKNATEAMSQKEIAERVLEISTTAEENHVKIVVSDSGIGIDPSEINRIFNQGYSTKSDGHGFGLHSSAIFMSEMKGKIWVESKGKNKGSSFHLQFPLPE